MKRKAARGIDAALWLAAEIRVFRSGMAILTLQSQLAAGYVGNSAAVFALQRLGREVWPLPTVLLSHHPAHGGSMGGPIPLSLQAEILEGLTRRGGFAKCEAVLSGYLGQAKAADIVRRAVAAAKAGTPGAIYLCDPVFGDDGRFYAGQDIVARMRELAAMADIVTPNAFELGVLSGTTAATRQQALQAMRILQARGPGIVVLTSFIGADTPAATLDVMALDGAAAWRLNLPGLRQKFYGAGDLFAAVFLDAWLPRRDTGAALGHAASATHAVLGATAWSAADELLLIESQHLLAAPPVVFSPERIE
jgi:pyridoxine kinase